MFFRQTFRPTPISSEIPGWVGTRQPLGRILHQKITKAKDILYLSTCQSIDLFKYSIESTHLSHSRNNYSQFTLVDAPFRARKAFDGDRTRRNSLPPHTDYRHQTKHSKSTREVIEKSNRSTPDIQLDTRDLDTHVQRLDCTTQTSLPSRLPRCAAN